MSYGATLEVLADPTRREIVDRLRRGPAPVGDIARRLPVSRPAVSKHLKLMLRAGVVRMEVDGTRHLYSLDLDKIDEVRHYLDRLWGSQLQRFKEAAEKRGGRQGRGK